jgi:Holliday junction resolvase RusA-like endonuclease
MAPGTMAAESVEVFIAGVPSAQSKTKGRLGGPKKWTEAIIRATFSSPVVQGPGSVNVTLLLPPEVFPTNLPFGTDLDNLLKRLFDALCQTVLRATSGKDSSIVEMVARKKKVAAGGPTGAMLLIRQIEAYHRHLRLARI